MLADSDGSLRRKKKKEKEVCVCVSIAHAQFGTLDFDGRVKVLTASVTACDPDVVEHTWPQYQLDGRLYIHI